MSVPLDAYIFALHLEDRGIHLVVNGPVLSAEPDAALTPEDRRDLSALASHLRTLARYQADDSHLTGAVGGLWRSTNETVHGVKKMEAHNDGAA